MKWVEKANARFVAYHAAEGEVMIDLKRQLESSFAYPPGSVGRALFQRDVLRRERGARRVAARAHRTCNWLVGVPFCTNPVTWVGKKTGARCDLHLPSGVKAKRAGR